MSHLRVYRTVYGIHIPDKVRFMSITDKVRFMSITDKVRYTRNTDFVYNGQKTLVPTGTLYTMFTVCIYIYIYIYLIKVANLAVECSMPYKQNVV